MKDWRQKPRFYAIDHDSSGHRALSDSDLLGQSDMVLLGPAGSGKSFELRRLAELERRDGRG